MRNRTHDLTSVLVEDKKGTVKYGQGVIISWNPTNLTNIIEWDGAKLVDLPVLAGAASASGFKSGDAVGLLGWDPSGKGGSTQWWVLGKITVPGVDTSFAEPGQYAPKLLAATTDPELGEGSTQAGFWYLTGAHCTFWAFLQFGTIGVNGGSGHYFVSLPFKPFNELSPIWSGTTGTAAGLGLPIGVGTSRDQSSTGSSQTGVAVLASESTAAIHNHAGSLPWGSTQPFTWAAGDRLLVTGSYLIDPDQEVDF